MVTQKSKTMLQIQIQTDLKQKSQQKAEDMGFTNIADLVRFMLIGLTNGEIGIRYHHFADTEILTPEYAQTLETSHAELVKDIKSDKAKPYSNADDMISDLTND